MAKTEQEIRGKVGNMVFYKMGSETRVRSTASDFQDADSEGQRSGRSRLRVATLFYQRLTKVISREIWKLAAAGTSQNGFNLFMKKNMMVFTPCGNVGDFSRLCLTAGVLQQVNHLEVTADDAGWVTLTWEVGINSPSAGDEDRLRVIVLLSDRCFSPFVVEGVDARRKDGRMTFRLERTRGQAAHLYCFFSGKGGMTYSSSQYVRVDE